MLDADLTNTVPMHSQALSSNPIRHVNVPAGRLYILTDTAYKRHQREDHTTDRLSFEQRRVENSVPMFKFWSITLDAELAFMVFLPPLRQGNISRH